MKITLNCGGRLLDLSTPAIMGIINLTTDSFVKDSRISGEEKLLDRVGKMLEEGADIIDIGGQSTRPGAELINIEEEWNRLGPAMKSIRTHFPETIISVDTFYGEIAERCLEEGAGIINDISAGSIDSNIIDVVAEHRATYILMHMKGVPVNMQANPHYENLLNELITFFTEKIISLKEKGITDIIIDPGFGFGKTTEHNYKILQSLNLFGAIFGRPVMAGLSRKSMVSKVLGIKNIESLNGTTALNTIALLNGATILRVHDVKEAVEVKKLYLEYNKNEVSK